MFYDMSSHQSSQVFGDKATPFRPERERKVVVQPVMNEFIEMGGRDRDLVCFRLLWASLYYDKIEELIKTREATTLAKHPRLTDTAGPSREMTNIQRLSNASTAKDSLL
ncbi:STE family protein kinase [Apiospora phragmitis]|uniref:STE family protein kinase n=1 Tax=Apiospora phragmitis TaxID=2905665 RepID=A0ABR1URV8_9PEZI